MIYDFDANEARDIVLRARSDRWKEVKDAVFMFLRSQFRKGLKRVSLALKRPDIDEYDLEAILIYNMELSQEEWDRLVAYLNENGFHAKIEQESYIGGRMWSREKYTVDYLVVSLECEEEPK